MLVSKPTACAFAVAFSALIACGPVIADKPPWAGEKGAKGRADRDERASPAPALDRADRERFAEPHRGHVREYYEGQFRAGKCPPGLAKKQNGCMPPGQAKKYDVGRPLPREVRYYEVPAPLVTRLGPPPAGYRYVRVDDDILLLALGTRMVVDAIRGLGR